MTYVVQEAGKSQDKNTTAVSRTLNEASLNDGEKTNTWQVCGQVTKTGQTKPAGRRRNHPKISAWLRKWSELTTSWKARAAHRYQHASMRAGSKMGQTERSRQIRDTLKLTEQQIKPEKKYAHKTQEETKKTWLGEGKQDKKVSATERDNALCLQTSFSRGIADTPIRR